jgi:hypothetical protein
MLGILARTMNMFCKEREYPRISLQTLLGFTEDKQAARRFTYRFLPWSLGSVAALLCFGVFLFIPLYIGKYDPVPQIFVILAGVSFTVCIVLFGITWRRMVSGVPVSPRSGQPMEVYQLEDTVKDEKYELVYICRQSHTYFRLVFKAPGD